MIIPEGQPGAGIEQLAVVQEQHYDAWGLAFGVPSPVERAGGEVPDRFTYNSKELLTDLELGWNDYGARMYMSEIGRYGVIDNYSFKYKNNSPYSYVSNNPIYYIDINGDSLDIANNSQTINDINSLVSEENRQFLGFEGTGEFLNLTINMNGLPDELIAAIFGNDEGLLLVGQLINANEKYLYEASELALMRDENGNSKGVVFIMIIMVLSMHPMVEKIVIIQIPFYPPQIMMDI